MATPKPDGASFLASFADCASPAQHRKDGGFRIVLDIPDTETTIAAAAYLALKDVVFRVRLEPEG